MHAYLHGVNIAYTTCCASIAIDDACMGYCVQEYFIMLLNYAVSATSLFCRVLIYTIHTPCQSSEYNHEHATEEIMMKFS